MLEINNLGKRFGGLVAVNELTFKVQKGEILGIIGPNGAGKSTVMNMIDGSLKASDGKIIFNGEDITHLSPHGRAQIGIARVFQQNILFSDISVLDNLMIALQASAGTRFWMNFLGLKNSIKRHEKHLLGRAEEILKSVGLFEERDKNAASLPHASQRLLCLGISLAIDPVILLLDEPLSGMTAEEVTFMLTVVKDLREKNGITCIIVEHNMKAMLSLCDRLVAICFGQKLTEGSPTEVSQDPNVVEAYLGKRENAI